CDMALSSLGLCSLTGDISNVKMSMFSPMSPRIRATNLHPGPWIVDPKALAEGRMLADAVTIKVGPRR
ncbi:hypothetical protein KXV41_006221, partial [Aspergillus fumigatus]